jgi:hypothetical protein
MAYGCIACARALEKRVNMRSQCANWRDPSMMQKPMPPGCVFSVSPAFLGQHSEGRDYLLQSLAWYAQESMSHSFRFGLIRRPPAWLFCLAYSGFRVSIRPRNRWRCAALKAARLQHACSLCCALAEGACMTAALERRPRWVVRAANWLVQLAEKHDLYFWKTYGELFLVWAQQFRHSDVSQTTLFSSLRAMGLDWQYSPCCQKLMLAWRSKPPARGKKTGARQN